MALARMQTQPDPQGGESTSPVVYTAITAPLSLNVKWPRTCQGDNLSCAGACDRQATHINEDANGELVAMCDPCAEVMNGYKAEYLAREYYCQAAVVSGIDRARFEPCGAFPAHDWSRLRNRWKPRHCELHLTPDEVAGRERAEREAREEAAKFKREREDAQAGEEPGAADNQAYRCQHNGRCVHDVGAAQARGASRWCLFRLAS